MIVEDNPDFGALLCEALLTLDPAITPTLVTTGSDDLELISQSDDQPELLLVDLGLPDMSGIDVIRVARQRFSDLPILVVSVLSNDESVLQAIKAGAQGYLHKGDNVLSVVAAIKSVQAGEYPISSSLASYLFKVAATHTQDQQPNALLTHKELEILQLLSRGFTYSETARRLNLSITTIQTHIKRIYSKLKVDSKVKAINQAMSQGLL